MKGRDKLFFNLLTFLMVVAIGLVGWRAKDVDKQVKKWQADIKRRQERGVEDPVLKETVDKLESDLRGRLAEEFVLERDPLKLTEVIKTRKFMKAIGMLETLESDTKMRLSCTITGEKGSSAVIKFHNQSLVLSEGDQIKVKIGDRVENTGYKVESIGVNRIVVTRGGERIVLVTERAPDTIAEDEKRFGKEGERIPVVEVKQVTDGGNY